MRRLDKEVRARHAKVLEGLKTVDEKPWGQDPEITHRVIRHLVQYGRDVSRWYCSDEFDTLCEDLVLALGNHSFVSNKSGRLYLAKEPDLGQVQDILLDMAEYLGFEDFTLPEESEIVDLNRWKAQEQANGVVKS